MDANAKSIDSLVVEATEAHRPGLERYVRTLVRDSDEAADIVQETCVRLLVVARADGLPESPGAWMAGSPTTSSSARPAAARPPTARPIGWCRTTRPAPPRTR